MYNEQNTNKMNNKLNILVILNIFNSLPTFLVKARKYMLISALYLSKLTAQQQMETKALAERLCT
jgi:hypothetical protein